MRVMQRKICSKLTKGKEKQCTIANIAHGGDKDSCITLTSSSAIGHKDK